MDVRRHLEIAGDMLAEEANNDTLMPAILAMHNLVGDGLAEWLAYKKKQLEEFETGFRYGVARYLSWKRSHPDYPVFNSNERGRLDTIEDINRVKDLWEEADESRYLRIFYVRKTDNLCYYVTLHVRTEAAITHNSVPDFYISLQPGRWTYNPRKENGSIPTE